MSANPNSAAAEPAPVKPPRPKTVQYALYALSVRGVFSVLFALALRGSKGELRTLLADANKTKGWDNAELNHQVDLFLRGSLIGAGEMIVLLALVAKFVWDGKAWARWVYLAVVVLLARDEYALIYAFTYHNWLVRITTLVVGLAGLGSVVLLFLPASNAYYRPLAGTGRPGLFGALTQPRVRPSAATGGGPAVKAPATAQTRPTQSRSTKARPAQAEVSLTKQPEAVRPNGPRGKSRQSPPKRPGGR